MKVANLKLFSSAALMRNLLLVILLSIAAQANAITVNLSAKLTDVGANYFGGGVVDLFHVGDVVNFSFTYDPYVVDAPTDSNGMKYVVSQFSISSAAYSATVYNRGAIRFVDNGDYDSFWMSSGYSGLTESYGIPLPDVPLMNGYYLSDVGFILSTFSGAFISNALDQPINLSDFQSTSFYFGFREPGTTYAMGTMQSSQILSFSSDAGTVPEPSAISLLGLGLLAAVAARRKRGS